MVEAALDGSGSGRLAFPLRLLRVGLGLVLLACASTLLNRQSVAMSGVSVVWLPNALLIGVLLCATKRQWPALLVLGYGVDFLVNLALGTPVEGALFFSASNMIEVTVAATLMAPAIAPAPDLTQAKQMRSLLLYGVLLAPAITALMAASFLRVTAGILYSQSLRFWFAADLLGVATLTPLYLSYHHGREFSPRSRLEIAGLFLLLCGVTFVVFRLASSPMLWVVLLFLLLLGVRLGFTGSSLGLLAVTFIGGHYTVLGYGPLRPALGHPLTERILVFQIFIASSMLALSLTEVAMAGNRRTRWSLELSETRFRSMAEASRDVIVLADLAGDRQYVSPAVTELLGWGPEALVEGGSGEEIVHRQDVPKMRAMLADLRAQRQPGPVAFRGLKKDGSNLWLEATARLLRDEGTGEATGFVYVLRDISDRKAAEENMRQAFEAAEKLAMLDGLTGVANRRLLDQTLNLEWRRGRREARPLSLLLIDVDYFKAFNDLYGHLAGDTCLRRIAGAIQNVLRRPVDVLARYGGEEFVAVLPNTPSEGAEVIAERVRKAVEAMAVPHTGDAGGIVTVSIGCATEVPRVVASVSGLLKSADQALYRAKANGRNRTEIASEGLPVS